MEDKEIYSDLGRLSAEIINISYVIQESKREDKEFREFVKEKLVVLDGLERDFKEASPVIKEIRVWKERTIGAIMLVSAIAGIISFFIQDLFNLIKYKLGF